MTLCYEMVYIVDLAMPWEGSVEKFSKSKLDSYLNVAADIQLSTVKVEEPTEIDCSACVATSTVRLKHAGVQYRAHHQTSLTSSTVKDLSAADTAGHWIWIRQQNTIWATKATSTWCHGGGVNLGC